MTDTNDSAKNETTDDTASEKAVTDPWVELLHEFAAAALEGVGFVCQAKFSSETLQGVDRKYKR